MSNDSAVPSTAHMEDILAKLMESVQYAVNRLDVDKNQPQVAGDLAVALAYTKSQLASSPSTPAPSGQQISSQEKLDNSLPEGVKEIATIRQFEIGDGQQEYLFTCDLCPGLVVVGKSLDGCVAAILPVWKKLWEFAPKQVPKPDAAFQSAIAPIPPSMEVLRWAFARRDFYQAAASPETLEANPPIEWKVARYIIETSAAPETGTNFKGD